MQSHKILKKSHDLNPQSHKIPENIIYPIDLNKDTISFRSSSHQVRKAKGVTPRPVSDEEIVERLGI